jgi:hypothetical protein
MKKTLILLFLIAFQSVCVGQHCKFDNSYTVLLKLISEKKHKIDIKNYRITLQSNTESFKEIKDTCFQNSFLFDDIKTVLRQRNDKIWNLYVKKQGNLKIFKNNYLAILFYKSAIECLLNQSISKNELLVICRNVKTNETVKTVISKDQIFNLCSQFGSWDRIKPIIIAVN